MVKKMIAVIPARGGSKRIPNKNIVDFLGKPMLALTIEAAQKSALFERIFVSTDDQKFARFDKPVEAKTFYGPGHRMFPMDWKAAVDIDNYDDLEMAKALYMMRESDRA